MNDSGAEYLLRAIFGEAFRALYPYAVFKDSTQQTLSEAMQAAVDSLQKDREKKILELRFGLADGKRRVLDEVKKEFGVTRERIRQIEVRALRKLRHPSRSKGLWRFFVPSPEDMASLWNELAEKDLLAKENAELKTLIELHGISSRSLQSPGREDPLLLENAFKAAERSFPERAHGLHQIRNALIKSNICTFSGFCALVESGELTKMRNIGVTLLELAREVVRIGTELAADG